MKRITLALAVCLSLAAKALASDSTNGLPVLTLADAERLALKNHPRIIAADFNTLAAEEAVKESRSGFFPGVNLVADAVGAGSDTTRIMAGGLNNPSIFNRAAGGVAVNQLITDFGRTANLTASSRFQAQAAGQNADATREQVLLDVNMQYFGTLEAQAVLRVAQQTLDTRQVLLDQVTLLASNQLKSELDVSFARVALEEGRLLVQRAQNNADAAMASLSTSLGLREPQSFQLIEQSPGDFSGTNDVSALVQTALADRPELLSLRNSHSAAISFAKSQRDSRLPDLQAVGMAGSAPVHDNRLPNDYAAAGIQLSVPLFAGGLYSARQHEAEYRAQADDELLRAAEDDIVRDVHIAWLNVINALQQVKITGQLVRNASEAFDLAQARYKIGSSSIVELSQAQLSLTSAQIDDTNARYNVLIQQANLDHEIGALR
jgi:outer membrane protein